jgi:hypothetical protein
MGCSRSAISVVRSIDLYFSSTCQARPADGRIWQIFVNRNDKSMSALSLGWSVKRGLPSLGFTLYKFPLYTVVHSEENSQLPANMKPLDLKSNERLNLFRRQYIQLYNPDSLAFPGPDDLRNESFQNLLYESMFKPGVLAYPPKDRYQLRVLKELVLRVEQSIMNPEEDVCRVSHISSQCLKSAGYYLMLSMAAL